MVSVRERIRINGNPLSEEVFAKFFFEVWDALDVNTKVSFGSSVLWCKLNPVTEEESGYTN